MGRATAPLFADEGALVAGTARPADGGGPLTKGDRSIAGRVAIVTGAASGMGRATAHLFADEGALVAVTDRTQEGVDAVVKEIDDAGGTALGWVLDVTDADRIVAVVAEIEE